MKKAFLLVLLLFASAGQCNDQVLPGSADTDAVQMQEWLANELRLLEKAARDFEVKQNRAAPAVRVRVENIIQDLNTMIQALDASVNRRDNPAYHFEPLAAETAGY